MQKNLHHKEFHQELTEVNRLTVTVAQTSGGEEKLPSSSFPSTEWCRLEHSLTLKWQVLLGHPSGAKMFSSRIVNLNLTLYKLNNLDEEFIFMF